MNEMKPETLDRNLQTILHRYSLVGEDSDPAAMDISNFDRRYGESLAARKDRLYGELTSHGLVLVWASADKSQYCTADVLVIDSSSLITESHVYNQHTGDYDWYDYTGVPTGIPLNGQADTLVTLPYDQVVPRGHTKRHARIRASYMRTAHVVKKMAAAGSENDALHQIVAHRNEQVHENLQQLYPYAGEPYGPRVNLEEMIHADVPFHPAVAKALRLVPGMTVDD